MLNWSLDEDEILLWQGRPAPRCYLFRYWRSISLSSLALGLIVSVLWWFGGPGLPPSSLALLLLLIALCAVFGPIRLVLLRWRWESVFYAVTDRRTLVQKSFKRVPRSYPHKQLRRIVIHSYSERLASIELLFEGFSVVVLECLEEPDACLESLPLLRPENKTASSQRI